MTQIISEVFSGVGEVAVLTGPSHAEEVASGQPVVMVGASASANAQKKVKDLFSAESSRDCTQIATKAVLSRVATLVVSKIPCRTLLVICVAKGWLGSMGPPTRPAQPFAPNSVMALGMPPPEPKPILL